MNDALITAYGDQWARNKKNIEALRRRGKFWGVYVLCDGSMPIYIGRGRIARNISEVGQRARPGTIFPGMPYVNGNTRPTLKPCCSGCFRTIYGVSIRREQNSRLRNV